MKRRTSRSSIGEPYTVVRAFTRAAVTRGRAARRRGGRPGRRCSPTVSISVRMFGCGRASHSVRPCARRRCARHARSIISDGSAKRQLGEVDDDVARGLQRGGERTTAASARRAVLVPRDPQDRQLFVEAERCWQRYIHTPRFVQGLEQIIRTLRRMIDEDDVLEALSATSSIPSSGSISSSSDWSTASRSTAARVNVTFTLTTPACPIGPQVSEQMQEFVGERPRRRRGRPEHGLHAPVDPGQDVRGREVRSRLLARLPFDAVAWAASTSSCRASSRNCANSSRSGIAS